VFRRIVSLLPSLSLERKCLLFFGSALLLVMCAMFITFFQIIAYPQAMKVPQQTAKDFANVLLARRHHEALVAQETNDLMLQQKEVPGALLARRQRNEKILARLDAYFLGNVERSGTTPAAGSQDVVADFLTLGDEPSFEDLPSAEERRPADDQEVQLLDRLEVAYRNRLAEILPEQMAAAGQLARVDGELLGPDAAFAQITPRETPLFEEDGPVRGRYVYYAPVMMHYNCRICHAPTAGWPEGTQNDAVKLAEAMPFRVVRVSLPYSPTEDALTWIRAVIITLAMILIAVTLFVLYAIVRFLVLRPLYHLRDVSEAITRGSSQVRAELDTRDEFEELGDAFNRMLQYLMESQDRLRDLNSTLDQKVDQLAQLNLQLYEANRLKSDFLANMSHELRTPLNSIIGFSDVLADIDSLSDKQRRYARNIQQSGRVLLEMINDILDLAKVEAGKMEVRPAKLDVGQLVHAQCDMVRSLSEDKNIDLTVHIADTMTTAWQDANKIGQILTNLLSNAIKFTPEGGLVTVRAEDSDDHHFQISVADTGVGVPEEDHAVIFEKFRQSRVVAGEDGMKREFSGTGLGLSIVKELCKLLGGEITFTSSLGRGSTFVVMLPFRYVARNPPPSTTISIPDDRLLNESVSTEVLKRQDPST
jgi:two-component system, NarL family, sensor histidine kinase BarA